MGSDTQIHFKHRMVAVLTEIGIAGIPHKLFQVLLTLNTQAFQTSRCQKTRNSDHARSGTGRAGDNRLSRNFSTLCEIAARFYTPYTAAMASQNLQIRFLRQTLIEAHFRLGRRMINRIVTMKSQLTCTDQRLAKI
ncbi:hypothetical protein ALQ32_200076 [Pseudomonas syringae pv. tagetis]|uniref:Transposase n=1 Tax=Pseudomonas syringae pv. tagetis TaxID=129140 RepID=A0A3M3YUI6_9PSED|nr:hypothetical protein ALQ32_200076 [Pseudomonas syringae pv. tagetis]